MNDYPQSTTYLLKIDLIYYIKKATDPIYYVGKATDPIYYAVKATARRYESYISYIYLGTIVRLSIMFSIWFHAY